MKTNAKMRCKSVATFCLLAAIGCMLVGMAARAEAGARLQAGAAKVDITPKLGVSLDGPISKNGPVRGVHDRLYARAVMLDDGTTRLAIVVADSCVIGPDVYDAAAAVEGWDALLAFLRAELP